MRFCHQGSIFQQRKITKCRLIEQYFIHYSPRNQVVRKGTWVQMCIRDRLNSYFTNYRHIQQVSEKKDRHGLCSTIQNGTCSELKIMKYLNVWIMAPMLESYPKINADHCREANICLLYTSRCV